MKDATAESAACADARSAQGDGLVAGGVVSAYRASLVERDLWDYVRRAFEQRAGFDEHWLDEVSGHDWVELRVYVALIEAIGETLGVDELRSLVRRRLIDPAGSNFYSSMLRSWARSFGASPLHMLRGAVHVWRASQRNTGALHAHPVSAGEVHLVVEGRAAERYRDSAALAASLEGLALGFLDLAQPRPVFLEVEFSQVREPVCLVCRFGD